MHIRSASYKIVELFSGQKIISLNNYLRVDEYKEGESIY